VFGAPDKHSKKEPANHDHARVYIEVECTQGPVPFEIVGDEMLWFAVYLVLPEIQISNDV
jgi:hypothetical protein